MSGDRGPALVVDPAVAHHLEVLRAPAFLGRRVVEAVAHRGSLHPLLGHPLDGLGQRQTGGVEHGGQHVDHVVELVADLPACLHAGRPVHHQAVAGAAEVRGDLLGPLVRRVHGQRPAHRIHRVGHRPADLVDPGVHVGDVVGDPVTDEVLADGALRAALAGGAVVPEQVDQQGVVEDARARRGCRPAGRSARRRARRTRRRSPSAGWPRAWRRRRARPSAALRPPRETARRQGRRCRAASGVRGCPRAWRPSRRRTGPRTARSTRSRRATARGWRRGPRRRRRAAPGSATAGCAPRHRRGR